MAEVIITDKEMKRLSHVEPDPFWNDETARRYRDEFIHHEKTEHRLFVLATALAFSVAGLFVSCVAIISR